MSKDRLILPELLAPAGSAESAAAAISGGADAIYFGAERFSARARAKNLSGDEITNLMRQCYGRGVKAYGAINTRLRDGELSDAVECAWKMLSAGATGLIVADLGLAAILRETFPEAVLHASTQISGTSAADAEVLARLGFSRMVCPRELTAEEIAELVQKSSIGIEAFIHGAHCVSVSGQCSMSYVMGGRSGNRGDCAGPCRLPFDAGLGPATSGIKPKNFALSLKDMCLGGNIQDLVSAGVESLKIEGRLKGPEYTYGVVKIYRTLLDEGRNATSDEIARLSEFFSRDGFSDGYLQGRYSNMLGTKKDSERRRDANTVVPEANKIPVTGELRLYCGEAAKLTLTSPVGSAEVTGDILSAAVGNPPSEDSITKSISKLGSTPFVLRSLKIDTDGICGIAASALNLLRRNAAEILCTPPAPVRRELARTNAEKSTAEGIATRSATLVSASQLTDFVTDFFDYVYLPVQEFSKIQDLPQKVGLSLPDVMYGALTSVVKDAVSRASAEGRRVLVHSIGELDIAVKAGCTAVCSHRFVVYNSQSAAVLKRLGAKSVTLSPEVTVNAARSISAACPVSVITGGRMPLMLCRRCPVSDGGRVCKLGRIGGFDGKTKKGVCHGFLRDRTGAVLPTTGDAYCMTTIYNSVPTYTDITIADAASIGISDMMHIFSSESPDECNNVVKMLKDGIAPKEYRKLR